MTAVTESSVLTTVQNIVADALALDLDEVTPESTLFVDLGTESIDLLDFLFRIEQELGVKIQAAQLSEIIQGGIPDEEFGTPEGMVSSAGLAQLKKTMPQLDEDALAGKLPAEDVMNHFTVGNLAAIVAAHGADRA